MRQVTGLHARTGCPRRTATVAAVACVAGALVSGAAAAAPRPTGDVKQYQSSQVQQYQAKTLQPSGSSAVQPKQSGTLKQYQSKSVKLNAPPPVRKRPVEWFVGAWATWVPGGTYERPAGNDMVQQVTSAGAAGRQLVVLANGTYRWGAIAGRWRRTGDAAYPILLQRALDGHDWKLGTAPASARNAQITLWDGLTYELGKRG